MPVISADDDVQVNAGEQSGGGFFNAIGNAFRDGFKERQGPEGVTMSPFDNAMQTLSKTLLESSDPDKQTQGKILSAYYGSKDYAQKFNYKKKVHDAYNNFIPSIQPILQDNSLSLEDKKLKISGIKSLISQGLIEAGAPNDDVMKYDYAMDKFLKEKLSGEESIYRDKQRIMQDVVQNPMFSDASEEDIQKEVSRRYNLKSTNSIGFEKQKVADKNTIQAEKDKKADAKSIKKNFESDFKDVIKKYDYNSLRKYDPNYGVSKDEWKQGRDEIFNNYKNLAGEKWALENPDKISRAKYYEMIKDAVKNQNSESEEALGFLNGGKTSGSGLDLLQNSVAGKVLMRAPNGETAYISKKDVQAALRKGARVL